jgi:hypothetical protein
MSKAKLYEVPDATKPHVVGLLGDKAFMHLWDLALDTQASYLSKLVELKYTLVQGDGRIRVKGFADPNNGVKTLTSKGGIPAVFIKPSDHYPDVPSRLVSEASDWSATPSKVGPLLFPNLKERREVYGKRFRAVMPEPDWYTTARYNDVVAIDRNTERAIERVMPVEHEGTVELCLIRAYDKAQATEIAKSEGLPFAEVNTTPQGEPLALGWHGQKPSVDEVAAHNRVQDRQRAAARVQLDRELRDFEQRRRTELGLI